MTPTPIGSSTLHHQAGLLVATSAPNGPSGVALLGAFFGGHRHDFTVWVRLGTAEVLRIEVHGSISRMSKVVVHIARDGTILLRGEEVDRLQVWSKNDGLQIELSFLAYVSAVDWIYLFGRDTTDAAGPVLSCAGASLQPVAEARPHPVRHLPLRRVADAHAICQSFAVLNNVFTLTFEIVRPGSRLVGLGLTTDLEVLQARWWTWALQDLQPRHGELVASRPVHPIPSPALMDAFGPGHSGLGHAISGVYADWHELARQTIADADRRANLTLHARFDCGAVIDLPVTDILTNPEALPISHMLVDRYCAEHLATCGGKPVFLEVGARGPASARMRRKVEAGWTYVGMDYLADNNVDIVGDAHRLTDLIAQGSIDMVYSSEVMEHLLSPLRFVLEANRVLKTGGLFIARMPTIWPLHAEPWDYWRITRHGWTSLLNINTGFEILDRCEDGHASVVPHQPETGSGVMHMASAPAPMLTMVVARKIAEVPVDTSGWSPGLALGSYDHA
ncbi:methyltransferase domain-containing protein [Rhodobacter sp. SY28-1]|uniref:methyltransferase domain-containing protein n=1 Tax=Rhodobacter sp. SY28-1 TaxID=2562317 RepID=UPI001484F4EB|nr:methyltransferase domain-containing protein [Rhodobacter sp. SY28-1]